MLELPKTNLLTYLDSKLLKKSSEKEKTEEEEEEAEAAVEAEVEEISLVEEVEDKTRASMSMKMLSQLSEK